MVINDDAERIGYYFGFNFMLYVAIGLFLKANSLKRKLKLIEELEMINSIGQSNGATSADNDDGG